MATHLGSLGPDVSAQNKDSNACLVRMQGGDQSGSPQGKTRTRYLLVTMKQDAEEGQQGAEISSGGGVAQGEHTD